MLENKADFTKIDLEVIFGKDKLLNFDENFSCVGISIDTRTILPGNAFIALKGEKSDGHTKTTEALDKGASVLIMEKEWFKNNSLNLNSSPVILCDNTLNALGRLASFHRKRFDYPLLLIGGSNGKTTTKEMTAHLLSAKYNVLKTYENFNNQIGVPLMLLGMNENFNLTVLEIGTNEPGEVAILSEMAAPTHGLITNIGKEHLELLVDLDGVEMEETFLYGWLKKKDGIVFINTDDERLVKYQALFDKYVSYGTKQNSNVQALISLDEKLHPEIEINYKEQKFVFKLHTFGLASAYNAIAAASIALSFDVEPGLIVHQFDSFLPLKWHGYARMSIDEYIFGGLKIKIINDCYNANPSSMLLAINSLKTFDSKGRKIAVLGDMLELGECSYEEHCRLLELAVEISDLCILTGNEMKKAIDSKNYGKIINYFETKDEILSFYKNEMNDEDVILVKGSRGMKMEQFIEGLEKISS